MKKWWLNPLTISIFITLISLFIYKFDFFFFRLLELKAYDFLMSTRGVRPVSDKVVIISIDEKSLKQEGRWPWPRTRLAKLIDRLVENGVSAIGIDLLFPEKDDHVSYDEFITNFKKQKFKPQDPGEIINWLGSLENADQQFAASLTHSDRTVLSYFVYSSKEQAGELVLPMSSNDFDLLDFSQYPLVKNEKDSDPSTFLRSIYAVGMSMPVLMEAANSAGFVSFIPEHDGVIRRIPLIQSYKDYLFPPFSLQLIKEATGLNLFAHLLSQRVGEISLGGRSIPVSEEGDFLINFFGPSKTFSYFSATDVLHKKINPNRLKNKIVLIGATATAIHDLHTTPYGPLMPGVEVHANVIENILLDKFIQRPAWVPLFDAAMILAPGLLIGALALSLKAFGTAVLLVLGLVGFCTLDFYLFWVEGLWINTVYPIFSQLFVYFGITLYRFAFEEKEKRFIKEAFSQYLAPTVVDRLVNDPSLLKLGGERRVITAFFSDIAGFSSISEKMTPEDLVDLLNVYLTEMTQILMGQEGTVDKFEGDAIIAFFGAPISFKDHARRACWAALEMQDRLAELRKQWKEEGKPELFMRIGINTGTVVIGNLGSTSRMDYTMMGDSVNLASRLEGVNKQYYTEIIISQFTYEEAKDFIQVRELDLIRVVGKEQPIKIFELLGKKDEMKESIRKILPFYNEGLRHYQNQNWDEGIECFEKALNVDENDGPALTYFERCLTFQMHPPPKNWDGVFSVRTK